MLPLRGHVYVAGLIDDICKIGFSHDPVRRMAQIEVPKSIKSEYKGVKHLRPHLIHTVETVDCRSLESWLHRNFDNVRVPYTKEWFHLSLWDLDDIRALPSSIGTATLHTMRHGDLLDFIVLQSRERRRPFSQCPTCNTLTGGRVCSHCQHEHDRQGVMYSYRHRRLVPLTFTNALANLED